MKNEEIKNEYEKETGKLIIETLNERNLSPINMKGILVHSHGPFVWGETANDAVHNAVVLEELAKMAAHTETLNVHVKKMQDELLDKHFLRKHGENAYYGQKK